MKAIKRSEITEEVYWVFKCPKCGSMSDEYNDPDYEEEIECEHCNAVFEIGED